MESEENNCAVIDSQSAQSQGTCSKCMRLNEREPDEGNVSESPRTFHDLTSVM